LKKKKKILPVKEDNLSYKFYHWGPFLFHTKITSKECKIILREGEKCRKKSNDYRYTLAGHLSEEYTFTDAKDMVAWLNKYFEAYVVAYNKWRGGEHMLSTLTLESLWVNYMKANEFNPPHDHSGDLSFVIYPEMPKVITEENKRYKGTTMGPGGISFFYGQGDRQYINVVQHLPEPGDMFIFPASLKHWVYPFRSNIERVSVSGNIFFGPSITKDYFVK